MGVVKQILQIAISTGSWSFPRKTLKFILRPFQATQSKAGTYYSLHTKSCHA